MGFIRDIIDKIRRRRNPPEQDHPLIRRIDLEPTWMRKNQPFQKQPFQQLTGSQEDKERTNYLQPPLYP